MGLRNTFMGLAAGVFLLLIGSATPQEAAAQCCAPPPPPCCTPPSPPPCCTPPSPPPRPPSPPSCCDSGGGRVNVTVNANVTAVAVAGAGSRAGAGAGAVVYGGGGGGGGGYYAAPGATGLIQGLNVEGALKKKKVAYEAKRTRTRKVIIRAYCIDDRDTPHPASQVFTGEEVVAGYEGELYRCIAGTRMQWTLIEWSEKASNEGGKSIFCEKGESLYYEDGAGLAGGPAGEGSEAGPVHGGRIACRPQRPARDCNERSLLRRFGAGVKVVTIVEVETYTAYREEEVREESSSSFSMSLDGGVGGTIY